MVVTAGQTFGTIGGGALEWRLVEQARAVLTLPEGAWRVQDYPLGPLLGQCCGGRVRVLVERIAAVEWMGAVASGVVAELRYDTILRHPSAGWDLAVMEGAPAAGDPSLRWGDEGGRVSARGERPAVGDRFVEPDDTPRTPLMLFGAGHVGRAIAERVAGLPFDLAWFDSRPETDAIGATVQDEDALVACAADARGNVLILTHDHALDYRLTAAALGSEARFVGLIGSATKRARFVSRLQADGVDPARLTCPIGTAGIVGKEPAVIAIAALAQVLGL
jgi:xanthine dehydrogenase accessory factor